jgi:GT2 family glycosyltransferase
MARGAARLESEACDGLDFHTMNPALDIVIVNWNAGEQLRACLQSIRASTKSNFEVTRVVVVDNCSSDGSADGLARLSLPLEIMRNAENRGFGAACNQGANVSRADYLLFLNPDTTLAPESLTAPIRFMEEPGNSKVGACGIQLVDQDGQVLRSCSLFPKPGHFYAHMLGLNRVFSRRFPNNFMSNWDHADTRPVEAVIGAFLLVRREIFEALGGFDERFFVYLEDVDFLYRVAQANWRCYYLTTTRAYHKGGGCSEQAKAARLCYSLQSRILYFYKHFGRAAATGVLIGTLVVEPFSRLVLGAAHSSLLEIRDTFRAYRMLWGCLPKIVAKGREFPPGRPIDKELALE